MTAPSPTSAAPTVPAATPAGATPAARPPAAPRLGRMASALVGSEILKIAAEVRERVAAGAEVCNLTVGDFDPRYFRPPASFVEGVAAALRRGETNYPPAPGIQPLRQAVSDFWHRELGLDYPAAQVVICGGSRPAIYATYRALVDPGDRVVYPTPSWNNNHYVHLAGAEGVPVPCTAATGFLPTPALLAPHLRGARLLALNSPLNPAGTELDADALGGICDLVLDENRRRGASERPLYLMFDAVYWTLRFRDTPYAHPVSVRPEMARYTIYVDGISKAFASTGVRVGWLAGPPDLTPAMSDTLGHVGAWAPRAEQAATAELLASPEIIASYHRDLVAGVRRRLDLLHDGIAKLPGCEALAPEGAIYLSARFPLEGRSTPDGQRLDSGEAVRRYLLQAAGIALVPFGAFGVRDSDGWFRLSVGAVSLPEVEAALPRLAAAVAALGD